MGRLKRPRLRRGAASLLRCCRSWLLSLICIQMTSTGPTYTGTSDRGIFWTGNNEFIPVGDRPGESWPDSRPPGKRERFLASIMSIFSRLSIKMTLLKETIDRSRDDRRSYCRLDRKRPYLFLSRRLAAY